MYKSSTGKDDISVDGSYREGKKLPFTVGENYTVRVLQNSPRDNTGYITIRVFDNKIPVLNLNLSGAIWNGYKFYSINSAYVALNYQGNGICKELYTTLIKTYGMSLLTLGSHSEGASKTWLRVSRHPLINAYGFSAKTDKVWALTSNRKKTELVSKDPNNKMYGIPHAGIILTKKSSIHDIVLNYVCMGKRKRLLTEDFLYNDVFNQIRKDDFD